MCSTASRSFTRPWPVTDGSASARPLLLLLLCLSLLAFPGPGGAREALSRSGVEAQTGPTRETPSRDARTSVLKGFVYGHDLEPLLKAEVSVDAKLRAVTSETGYYEIFEVPYGKRTVKVAHPGLRSETITLDISRPYADFDVSLRHALDPKAESSARLRAKSPFLPKLSFAGFSGLIETPGIDILPRNSYAMGYRVGKAKVSKGPTDTRTVIHADLGIGMSDRIEFGLFHRDAEERPDVANLVNTQSGLSLKYKVPDPKRPMSIGARRLNDGTNEIYCAFRIRFLETEQLTVVPTFRSSPGNVYVDLGYSTPIAESERRRTLGLLEALMDREHRYRIWNAGVRHEVNTDHAIDWTWKVDRNQRTRTMSIGLSSNFL